MEVIRKPDSTPATTTLNDLATISKPGQITPREAWAGTNLMSALKTEHAADVRGAILKMMFETIKFIDCKKTLTSDDDVIFTFESLLNDFPVLKITEWKYVTDGMKSGRYGKYYERLKAAEFREAFIEYESTDRALILETAHKYDSMLKETAIDWTPIRHMLDHIGGFKPSTPVRKKMSGMAGNVKRKLFIDTDEYKELAKEMKDNSNA